MASERGGFLLMVSQVYFLITFLTTGLEYLIKRRLRKVQQQNITRWNLSPEPSKNWLARSPPENTIGIKHKREFSIIPQVPSSWGS